MTRLVVIGRKGPTFREPRSLADTLKASVDYMAELRRQAEAPSGVYVDPDSLPSDYALDEVNAELLLAVTK